MKTNVIEVREAPQMKNPAMLSGIKDKASAKAWGEKHGHAVVYFLYRRQRVYAEKTLAHVEVVAAGIEQASADLVAMAEAAV